LSRSGNMQRMEDGIMERKKSEDFEKEMKFFLELWNTPDLTDEELAQMPVPTDEEIKNSKEELDALIANSK